MRRLLQIASGLLLALIGILLYVERGQLLRRSTLRLLNESRRLHLHGGSFRHAFIYARWPREYIGTALKITVRYRVH